MPRFTRFHVAVVAAWPTTSHLLQSAKSLRKLELDLAPYRAADPLLARALDAISGRVKIPDTASSALSDLAEALQKECEANRSSPDWAEKALAMGRTRTAAANVWRNDVIDQVRS